MEVRYQLGLLPAGLLWNVNSHNMALVPAKQEEIAPLMACRNRLALHLWQDVPTPPRMLGVSLTRLYHVYISAFHAMLRFIITGIAVAVILCTHYTVLRSCYCRTPMLALAATAPPPVQQYMQ